MTEEQVEIAYQAGAEFIISPDCYDKVIKKRDIGMVSIPRVYTLTEVANAHRFGADIAKLFQTLRLNCLISKNWQFLFII